MFGVKNCEFAHSSPVLCSALCMQTQSVSRSREVTWDREPGGGLCVSSEPDCARMGSVGSLCYGWALEKGGSLCRVHVESDRAC